MTTHSPPQEVVLALQGAIPDFLVPIRRIGSFWSWIVGLIGSSAWLFLYGFVAKITINSAFTEHSIISVSPRP